MKSPSFLALRQISRSARSWATCRLSALIGVSEFHRIATNCLERPDWKWPAMCRKTFPGSASIARQFLLRRVREFALLYQPKRTPFQLEKTTRPCPACPGLRYPLAKRTGLTSFGQEWRKRQFELLQRPRRKRRHSWRSGACVKRETSRRSSPKAEELQTGDRYATSPRQ